MFTRPLTILTLMIAFSSGAAHAGDGHGSELVLNQHYLEALAEGPSLDLQNETEVFAFVFENLPFEVQVYPTENYYYFSFMQDGLEIDGNIRLDALDRDQGIVHFAYYSGYTEWNEDLVSAYQQLTTADGVAVTKIDRFVYDVSYGGQSVRFRLNNLTHVQPEADILAEGEEYIGPVYDESGLSFYLVYNRPQRLFHYVLNDEISAPEIYAPSRISQNIEIGQRTGFAMISDPHLNRRILVGVYTGSSILNNYFDGPFDQLPDNFIEGDTFKEILEHAYPVIAGQIDRFGNTDNGASRLLITPYIYYASQQDLLPVVDCVAENSDNADSYYRCLSYGQPDYNQLATED